MLEHLELLQVPGKRFFLLFYRFLLKPNTAGFAVRLQQPPPPGGKAGRVPSPRPPRSHWGRVR